MVTCCHAAACNTRGLWIDIASTACRHCIGHSTSFAGLRQTHSNALTLVLSIVTAAAGLDKQFAFNNNAAVGQGAVLDMLCFSNYTLV